MDVVIERDIPIPTSGLSRWPFATMKVGDSFLVEDKDDGLKALASATKYRRRSNPEARFRTKQYPDGSRRIWRVK